MDPLPFDELNKLISVLPAFADENGKLKDYDALLDMLEDFFLLAYANGVETANLTLGSDYHPTLDTVMDTVDREIAGKTWRQRVRDYYDNGGTVDDIARIADTEAHRDSNEAALRTATEAGATSKTWVTMMDDRVRETHDYLQSVTVPIDADFITYDGDRAQAPGQFTLAENNVNCRCWLSFS